MTEITEAVDLLEACEAIALLIYKELKKTGLTLPSLLDVVKTLAFDPVYKNAYVGIGKVFQEFKTIDLPSVAVLIGDVLADAVVRYKALQVELGKSV